MISCKSKTAISYKMGSRNISYGVTRTQRSQPHRTSFYDNRPAPPAGNIDAAWGHDLFADGSDLYSPAPMSIKGVSSSTPYVTPSLKPFGSYTPSLTAPAESSQAPAPAAPAQPAQQQQQKASSSLFDRLNGNASSANPSLLARLGLPNAARTQSPAFAASPAAAVSGAPSGPAADRRPTGPRVRNRPEPSRRVSNGRANGNSAPATVKMAEKRVVQVISDTEDDVMEIDRPEPVVAAPVGFVVRVANLVEGTTAEDIKVRISPTTRSRC